jgi:hypothetical protein
MRRLIAIVMLLWAALSLALWFRRLREDREDVVRS